MNENGHGLNQNLYRTEEYEANSFCLWPGILSMEKRHNPDFLSSNVSKTI